jgi:hypothetical protein
MLSADSLPQGGVGAKEKDRLALGEGMMGERWRGSGRGSADLDYSAHIAMHCMVSGDVMLILSNRLYPSVFSFPILLNLVVKRSRAAQHCTALQQSREAFLLEQWNGRYVLQHCSRSQ